MMIGKKQSSLETLIGQDSLFRGELTSKRVLRVDGVIEGNVQADFLIIGKTGSVKGDIFVRGVEVNGSIEGTIKAEEVVEIRPEGAVRGDIYTVKLIISEGALFAGHSYMRRPGEAVEESKSVGNEKKVERIF
jgi:cytoskeletal protein CcmA (bactofilin family)